MRKVLLIFIIFSVLINFQSLVFCDEPVKDVFAERIRESAKNWERGLKYALIIGISKYEKENIPTLKYSVNDSKAIANFLINESQTIYDEIIILNDKDATRENILRKIKEISNKTGPEDTFFMYYSGHGKENYLIPYNGDKDYLKATGLRLQDDIYYEINKMVAKQKILIIDSCHSSSLIDSNVIAKGNFEKTNINDNLLSQMGEGLYVMTSSRADEVSWENDKLFLSYFTYFVIEGLKGAADRIGENSFGNGDGYITADELYNYVSYKTNDTVMKELSMPQHPRRGFNGEGMLFLGKGVKTFRTKSYLTITAKPESIAYINNRIEGSTPINKKEITSGDYEIKVESKGFLPAKKNVYIGNNVDEFVNFELIKSSGFITINSIPWGKIYIDKIYVGITPLIEEKIDSGDHEIEILPENNSYTPLFQKIIVIPTQNNFFSWELSEKIK